MFILKFIQSIKISDKIFKLLPITHNYIDNINNINNINKNKIIFVTTNENYLIILSINLFVKETIILVYKIILIMN